MPGVDFISDQESARQSSQSGDVATISEGNCGPEDRLREDFQILHNSSVGEYGVKWRDSQAGDANTLSDMVLRTPSFLCEGSMCEL